MEDIFSKRAFTERIEFISSLSRGDNSAKGLQIVLQYSLIKEGEISAVIQGTTDTFKEIAKISQLSGPKLIMRSQNRDHWHTRIWSDDLLLGTVTNKPFYGSEMSYKVADLHFENFTIEKDIQIHELKERHLSFFLTGPRSLWAVYEIGEVSFTGEEKNEIKDSQIDLNEQLPFEIEVKPWYFYDKTQAPESFQLKTKVLVLHFKTIKSIEELSNEQFISEATAVVEDLTQLTSFISRQWITWYSYELQTSNILRTFVRKTRECSSVEIDHFRSVVPGFQAREFLKIAFTNIRKNRAMGINLHMPLVYFVSGVEAKYLEEQFSILFLALEKIKDMFALQEGIHTSLPNNIYKRLRSSVNEHLNKFFADYNIPSLLHTRLPWIIMKLPELNRPTLHTILLEYLFPKYKITWTDLYPQGSDFTLIKTRNQLFHSSAEIDIEHLIKELHRLQAIVERVILSMLGWSQYHNSPDEWKRNWLSSDKF
jgi:hypothetical protein